MSELNEPKMSGPKLPDDTGLRTSKVLYWSSYWRSAGIWAFLLATGQPSRLAQVNGGVRLFHADTRLSASSKLYGEKAWTVPVAVSYSEVSRPATMLGVRSYWDTGKAVPSGSDSPASIPTEVPDTATGM